MKLCLLSDLHLEFEPFFLSEQHDYDVLILAGDIHVKDKAISWIQENVPIDKPVLYVLGNHEFYGKAYPKHIHSLKEQVDGSNIHILENDIVTLNGVNFLGCTLWTNFELFGNARLSGFECQQRMSDFKKIRLSPKYSKFRSIDMAGIHRKSFNWLDKNLSRLQGEKNIVISHHAPSIESLPDEQKNHTISAAYASDLTDLIHKQQPAYWFHGHVHNSSQYNIGACQVICNPRGYPDERNPDFYKNLIIEC